MVGETVRFTRQDGVEEAWRIDAAADRLPPPVHTYAPGLVGPPGGSGAGRRARALARTVDRLDGRPAQARPRPSPFTPIADYAFLSNCHTGVLIAPDGAIDWLCVPRFDSPSVFGSLLDRQAGFFRFGPFGTIRAGCVCGPTRHQRAGDDVEDTDRLDHPRRGRRRALGPRRPDHPAHPAAGRRRRRAHARSHRRVHRRRVEVGECREPLFTTGDRPARGRSSTAATRPWTSRPTGRPRCASSRTSGSGSRQPCARPSHARSGRHRGPRAVLAEGLVVLSRATTTRAPTSCGRSTFLAHMVEPGLFLDHRWRYRSVVLGATSICSGTPHRHADLRPQVAALTTSLPETPGGERNWTTGTRGCEHDVDPAGAALARSTGKPTKSMQLLADDVEATWKKPDRLGDHAQRHRRPRPHRVDVRRLLGLRRQQDD